MSKKNKKSKVVILKQSQLSPQNYIRTQARSLPIVECLISEEWAKVGICNMLIARQHKTGNFTVGIYLIDLYCLGIKDAMWEFNISPDEYEDYKQRTGDIEEIDYVLAHNIIYGAEAYAQEIGFKPAKGFEIARFILEDDDDNIELIELEFGLEGKPCYMPGPNDTPAKIRQVIDTLTRTVGEGNFITGEFDEDFDEFEEGEFGDDDYLDDDEFEDDEDSQDDEVPSKAVTKFIRLTNKAYEEEIRTPEAKKMLEDFALGKNYEISVETDHIQFGSEDEEKEFKSLSQMLADENIKLQKIIKSIKSAIIVHPDNPSFYGLLQTAYVYAEENKKADELTLEMYERFPDYLFAKVSYANMLIDDGELESVPEIFGGNPDLDSIYHDRKVFYATEAEAFYATMCRYFIACDNIDSADLYMNALLANNLSINQPLVNAVKLELAYSKMHIIAAKKGIK